MSGYNALVPRETRRAAQPVGPYSQSVAFSYYHYVSAQLPIEPGTGHVVAGGIEQQARQCFENIKAIVERAESSMQDIVRVSVFVRSASDIAAINSVYAEFFTRYVPALTTVAVAALPMGAMVQIEALVCNGPGTIPGNPHVDDMIKVMAYTEQAPVNLWSNQAVAFAHYYNVSAQLPINPKTGKLVTGGVRKQTEQCLANLKTIVASMDGSCGDIVKVTVFVRELSDIDVVNEVYAETLLSAIDALQAGYAPARTVVAVAGLPMNALVQVEAIVAYGLGTPPQIAAPAGAVVKACNVPQVPVCALSTHAVAFSHYNHFSAQLPLDPVSGNMLPGDVLAQTMQCLKNLKAVVKGAGHVMRDVVKVTVFLRNLEDTSAVDEAYAQFFPDGLPARTLVGVAALPGDALVQIEAVLANAKGTAA